MTAISDQITKRRSGDAELETYRTLMQPPKVFRDGFGVPSMLGALFCGVLMMPGAIYLNLMVGGNMGAAATWVTVILFVEVARRALRPLNQSEVVILLMVAGAMVGGTGLFGDLIWRQFLTRSSPAQDAGLLGQFPTWWVPAPESPALAQRVLFHRDWLVPIALMVMLSVLSAISTYCMGYIFFRLTSDVEKLPFPMAPVDAAGTVALVEGEKGERSWRWTVFSGGAMLGVGFGAINVLVPTVTGAIFSKPLMLLPLPWLEMTPLVQSILPAVAFGAVLELGQLLVGMVLPFWAVMGTAAAILLTLLLNPALYRMGVLTTWQPGMDTVNTVYANNLDFWFSANVGVSLGLAFVSILQTVATLRRARRKRSARGGLLSTRDLPPGRGDFNLWIAVGLYVACSLLVLALCWVLLPGFRHMMWLVALMVFVYTPIISYVSARIIGIAGQTVDIPLVREGIFVLSGYRGADIWAAPIPIANYGAQAQQFRTLELVGTSFWSTVKAQAFTLPLMLILGFLIWSYVWSTAPIPSATFPYAQKTWELNARNSILMMSSTMGTAGGHTMFERAFHWEYLLAGAVACIGSFGVMSWLGLPTMAVYGFVRGIGGIPHPFILEVAGAVIARFYLHRRYGKERFLRAAPVLLAGYFTGTGLIGMLGAAIALIAGAVTRGVF